jgi:ABC-type multidrug transport system ATPase subunit
MDVRVRSLGKCFAKEEVLADLDLDLPSGQIVALVGLNGAGKTTLLRCLAGVILPTRGIVTWDGMPGMRDDPERHRRMMFLPDEPLVLWEQTVVEHLALFLRGYGADDRVADEAVVAVLGEFDLLDHACKRLGALSRGQRYKATLAALLLIRPELWLLDEPFASGMDPQGMLGFRRHAREAADAGACVVYTTQILEIAERFCDRLLVLGRGRLQVQFTRSELEAMPNDGPDSLAGRLDQFRDRR